MRPAPRRIQITDRIGGFGVSWPSRRPPALCRSAPERQQKLMRETVSAVLTTRASQGEKRQLPRHPCIPPISVAGFMHPTNQRTAPEYVVASLPMRLTMNTFRRPAGNLSGITHPLLQLT